MMRTFRYVVSGLDGHKKPWIVRGLITAEFPDLMYRIGPEVFDRLTKGDTTFGCPGEGACQGPYTITRVLFEDKDTDDDEAKMRDALKRLYDSSDVSWRHGVREVFVTEDFEAAQEAAWALLK